MALHMPNLNNEVNVLWAYYVITKICSIMLANVHNIVQ